MTEREQFGPWLRRERECRGISLQEIAEKTKIGAPLFAGLERNDVSRWPSGIYRRSFMRAYAEAIGLDAERLVEQFQRLFPAGDDQATSADSALDERTRSRGEQSSGARRQPDLAAAAAQARSARRGPTFPRRLAGLAIDLALVGAAGTVCLVAYGWPAAWPALAVSSAVVFLAAPVVTRKTPGMWLLTPRSAVDAVVPSSVDSGRPVARERSEERQLTVAHRAPDVPRYTNSAGLQPRAVRHGKKSPPGSSAAAQGRHPGTRAARRRGKRAARRTAK